jgi:biotin carboxyl carrier protein
MPVVTLRSGEHEYRVETHPNGVLIDGVETQPAARAVAAADGDTRWVYVDGELYQFEVLRSAVRRTAAHQGSLSAPMPATVRKINVQPGALVKKGDTLLVLEAMKMELPVRAAADGTVTAVRCREGELVQPGLVLVELA